MAVVTSNETDLDVVITTYYPRYLIILPGVMSSPLQQRLDKVVRGGEAMVVMIGDSPLVYRTDLGSTRFQQVNIVKAQPWLHLKWKVPNFGGRSLRLATFNCSYQTLMGPLDENKRPAWIDGYEMYFINFLSKRLNFSYTIEIPTGNRWGDQFPNGTWNGGMFAMLVAGEADIAFCGIWVTLKILTSPLEMTLPSSFSCVKMLVPRPRPIVAQWDGLFTPFKMDLWAMVVVITLLVSWIVKMFALYSTEDKEYIKSYRKFGASFMAVFSGLVGFFPKVKSNTSNNLQLIWISWGFFCMLITTLFCSALVSHLTTAKYTRKMETIKDLVENNFFWTATRVPDTEAVFNLNDPYHKAWVERVRLVPSEEERDRLAAKSKVSLWGDQWGNTISFDSAIKDKTLAKYEATSSCINRMNIAFALPKGSAYTFVINRYLMAFQEAGLFDKLISRLTAETAKDKPSMRELLRFTRTNSLQEGQFNLSNLLGSFYLLGVGLLLASVAFALEVTADKKKKSSERRKALAFSSSRRDGLYPDDYIYFKKQFFYH